MTWWFVGVAVILLVVGFAMGHLSGSTRTPRVRFRLRVWDGNLERWDTLYEREAMSAYNAIRWQKNENTPLSDPARTFTRHTVVVPEWTLVS